MLKDDNNLSQKFICVTMVDPAMSVLEIEEIPTVVSVHKKVTTNEVVDKMSA